MAAAAGQRVVFQDRYIIDDLDVIAKAKTNERNQKLELFEGHLRLSIFGANTRDAKTSFYSKLGNGVCSFTQGLGEAVRGVITDQRVVVDYLDQMIARLESFEKKTGNNFFDVEPDLTMRVIESLMHYSDEGSAQKESKLKIGSSALDHNVQEIGTEYRYLAERVEAFAKRAPNFASYQKKQRELDSDGFVVVNAEKAKAAQFAADVAAQAARRKAPTAGAAGVAGQRRRVSPTTLTDEQAKRLGGI
jgi:hypothetical protein